MKKPSYTVVSLSLVILSVFGLLVERLRPLIPPPRANRLQYETGEFLQQGAHSEVDWRTLSPAAFAEARRTGKPVMLFIGTPWSKTARDADDLVFSDREVVSFLNRYLVSLRIDGQADPKWLTAYLPLRRSTVPTLYGCQIWFLTPEGQLFDNGNELGTTRAVDPTEFSQILVRVRERLRAIRAGGPLAPVPGADQAADRNALVSPSFPVAYDFDRFERAFVSEANLPAGGFVRYGRVRIQPTVLSYLLLTGHYPELKAMLESILQGPLVDWLDGGFYRTYVPGPRSEVEFDKMSSENADLMMLFARSAILLREPNFRKIAEQTFDCLAGEFVQSGFVAGCRVGDNVARGRSARQSFSPKRLREILTPEQLDLAHQFLGLRTAENRSMSVRARDYRKLISGDPKIEQILEKLRNSRRGLETFAGKRQLDIHGYVVARLLECARLWNDETRLRIADDLFSRVDWFLAGDDVQHSLEEGASTEAYLGDYLAYADACLQYYLAFGRADALDRGFKVLRRARFLFENDVPGVWRLSLPKNDPLWPKDVDVPEILDLGRVSATAQAMRLCHTYGRLLRESADANASERGVAALELLQAGVSTASQMSVLSTNFGADSAGIMTAALRFGDDAYVLVVGRDCLRISHRLASRLPTRLVAPVLGSVHPRLQEQPPGCYLVSGGQTTGPFTEGQISVRLSSVIRRGASPNAP